ncbi:MAG: lysophospholipid acyltransferase family protein [Spirochaetales bacterium]
MSAFLVLLTVVAQLLLWDFWLKFLQALSRPLARRHLDRHVSGMARRLINLVAFYSKLDFELDRSLVTDVPDPCVVCANHQSVADIAIVLAALERHRVRFVAKQELSRGFPAVSEVLRIQGHALINRKGDFRKVSGQLKELGKQIDRGVTPALFPEGTRSRDGSVRTFHAGGVRTILSGRTAPITAVAVDGGYRFVSLKDLGGRLSSFVYRVKLVGVFNHDGTKGSIQNAVRGAQDAITDQIEVWRKQSEEGPAKKEDA